jgi:hypothetical protein
MFSSLHPSLYYLPSVLSSIFLKIVFSSQAISILSSTQPKNLLQNGPLIFFTDLRCFFQKLPENHPCHPDPIFPSTCHHPSSITSRHTHSNTQLKGKAMQFHAVHYGAPPH